MHGDHDTVPIEEISKKNIMNNKHSNFEKSVGNCERNERIMCILQKNLNKTLNKILLVPYRKKKSIDCVNEGQN